MCSEGLRERYVNPYTDFAFKLLFGTDLNKETQLYTLMHQSHKNKSRTQIQT